MSTTISCLLVLVCWVSLAWAQPPVEVTLSRVLDGDTLHVTDGTQVYKLRLIGVGTAERNSLVPCAKSWAEEATRYLTLLVTGQPLRLVFDVVLQDTYGRWLAYVYIPGELMVNALLIEYGLGAEADSGKNRQHREMFRQLEREAQIHRRGMWSGL